MAFDTTIFLFLFLPATLTLSFFARGKYSNPFLVVASLLFYTWGQLAYVLVLVGSIVLNYLIGLWLDRSQKANQKIILAMGVSANLLILSAFKYVPFLVNNLNVALSWAHFDKLPVPNPGWPIGVSFFTFQAITYLVDVYRKICPARRNLIDTALYVSFFPKLMAGPITSYGHMHAQLDTRKITTEKFALGARRFALGLGKKVLIANTLAVPVREIFGILPAAPGPTLAWFGALCFTLQIFFDFSGYSDMAIGLGHMFGFDIPENFNYPYISRSIREFWRRWHITLSNWFRDYLYIPMGGNRVSRWKTYFNLFLVFFLCGLWHGPRWTLVVWGLYHGFFMILERAGFERILKRIGFLRYLYAFTVVMVGWVFFQCKSISLAWTFIASMFGRSSDPDSVHFLSEFLSGQVVVALVFALMASTPFFAWLGKKTGISLMALKISQGGTSGTFLRSASTAAFFLLLVLSLLSIAGSTHNPFIYFQY